MNLHEYQAKAILKNYSVPLLGGRVVEGLEDLDSITAQLPIGSYAVKSQVHAGGRGAGHFLGDEGGKGGVRIVHSKEDAKAAAEAMLGGVLITKQTGQSGVKVKKVYIEECCTAIKREMYLSFLVDRSKNSVVAVASSEGGMDIEELAEKTPEKICSMSLNPFVPQGFVARKIAIFLGLQGYMRQAQALLCQLHRVFLEKDLNLLEINPLVVGEMKDGSYSLLCLDAKMVVDDNALYRHEDLREMAEEDEDPVARQAAEAGLSYVGLDGEIGCLVNGAGLAMATMDIIKHYGGRPANFLDVGGSASVENVTKAFHMILSDSNVRAILVNIFGGIMRCDIIAEAIIAAAKKVSISVPLVVRMKGTNVDQGRKVLADSGLKIRSEDDLGSAAAAVVELAEG